MSYDWKRYAQPLTLECSCGTKITTTWTLLAERRELIADFDEKHAACRGKRRAGGREGEQ